VNGIVREVEIDSAFSDSIILVGILNYRLLKVSIEPENVPVILEPGRLYPWDVIIFWCFPGTISQIRRRFQTHRIQEVWIELFFDEIVLLLH
jgi:hypothetical protein